MGNDIGHKALMPDVNMPGHELTAIFSWRWAKAQPVVLEWQNTRGASHTVDGELVVSLHRKLKWLIALLPRWHGLWWV